MNRPLLDHPLIFVLGKGGVGRTTITAALGHAAAQLGKRACVCELGGTAALPPLFGLEGRSFAFRRGGPGVDVWSLTVLEALEEFGVRKLHLPGFARGVLRNRFVSTFVDAVPGLHDLLLLGKVENLINEPRSDDPVYDTIIVDAPATGHGITLLTAAQTMTEITRAGPFYDLAHRIEVFLADRAKTAMVVTTLPEALPVSETLELVQQLDRSGFVPHTVVANRVEPPLLPGTVARPAVREALASVPHGEALDGLARQVWDRQDRQAAAVADLRDGMAALRAGMAAIQGPFATGDVPSEVGRALAEALA